MRAKWTSASWIALAAWAGCTGAAFGQQAPAQPAAQQTAGPQADGEVIDVVKIYGDRLIEDPGSYSVVGAETIQEVGANHPAEILNTVPGVNVQMNSGQELLIAIRSPVLPAGAGQGSFLILENGIPIRAPAFGNVNALFELHHETAEAIEVVRGPGSVRYGSNAVHGLINVIDPEPGAQTGTAVTVSANTLQRYRADASANMSAGGVDLWTGLSIMDDGGWRDSSGVDQQKLTVRAGWKGEDWKAIATVAGVNLNQETAGFIQGFEVYKDKEIAKTNPNPEAYRDAWVARANVRFEKDFGENKLTITPFAITQRMIFIQHFLPDQSTEKNGQDSYGLMTRVDFGPETARWSLGVDVQQADGYLKEIQSRASFGGPASNPTFPKGIHYDYDVDTLMIGAYAELDWDFAPNWSMLSGVRVEDHAYDYTTNIAPGTRGRFRVAPSRTDTFNLFTPKFGVTYSGFGWGNIYANYARGERAPQTSDAYRLQNLQTIQKLKVETLDSFELGARGRVGGTRFDIAAYTMRKNNFFFRDSDGLNVPDGKTDHKGIEMGLDGDLVQGLSWNLNVSWSDQVYDFNRNVAVNAEDIVSGYQIDTAPEWLWDAGLTWRSGPFTLGGSIEHVGEYYTNAANTALYNGHTIGHLRGSWAFSDNLEAFATWRNVTDVRYADRADFANGLDRYFPGEPSNVTLGVRVRK
jgi:outer membrane receptor protein involved in Fe transport